MLVATFCRCYCCSCYYPCCSVVVVAVVVVVAAAVVVVVVAVVVAAVVLFSHRILTSTGVQWSLHPEIPTLPGTHSAPFQKCIPKR